MTAARGNDQVTNRAFFLSPALSPSLRQARSYDPGRRDSLHQLHLYGGSWMSAVDAVPRQVSRVDELVAAVEARTGVSGWWG